MKGPKTIQLKFEIDDKYDFDHIRLISGDMERFIVIEFEFGSLANDVGLLSQMTDVISVYHICVEFEKTIELN